MCGIAGIFGINGQPVHQHELEAMCDALPRTASHKVDLAAARSLLA